MYVLLETNGTENQLNFKKHLTYIPLTISGSLVEHWYIRRG